MRSEVLTAIKAGGGRAATEKRVNDVVKVIAQKAIEKESVNTAKYVSQVGFSDLSKGTNADLGVKEYVWQNQQDERVRGNPSGLYPNAIPEHWYMQGIRCRWDDATVMMVNGKWVKRKPTMEMMHPGEAKGCRCFPRGIKRKIFPPIPPPSEGINLNGIRITMFRNEK
jgi:uncharacterized protein with gpF-like domain